MDPRIIRLKLTSGFAPEQYDAFLGEDQVGYLRLRSGSFTVSCPDVGGLLVYSASPAGRGEFQPDERDYYLRFAVRAILDWIDAGRPTEEPELPAPDVSYEIRG